MKKAQFSALIQYSINPTFTIKLHFATPPTPAFKMYTSTLASVLLLVLGATAQSGDYEGSCKDMTFHQIKEGSGLRRWTLEAQCLNDSRIFDFTSLRVGDCVGVDAQAKLHYATTYVYSHHLRLQSAHTCV